MKSNGTVDHDRALEPGFTAAASGGWVLTIVGPALLHDHCHQLSQHGSGWRRGPSGSGSLAPRCQGAARSSAPTPLARSAPWCLEAAGQRSPASLPPHPRVLVPSKGSEGLHILEVAPLLWVGPVGTGDASLNFPSPGFLTSKRLQLPDFNEKEGY